MEYLASGTGEAVDPSGLELRRPWTESPRRRRGWLVRRLLVVADVVGLVLAFALAQWAAGPANAGDLALLHEGLIFALALPGWVLAAKLHGLYDSDEERANHSTAEELVPVLGMISIGSWAFLLAAETTGLATTNLPKVMVFWAAAAALVVTARAAARAMCRRHSAYVQRTIVVGAGHVGQRVAEKILNHPEYGLRLVGFVDANPIARAGSVADVPVLGPPQDLARLVVRVAADRVIFAFSGDGHEPFLSSLRGIRSLPVQCDIVPRLFEVVGPDARLHALEGLPLVGLGPAGLPRSSQWIKRSFDLVVSLGSLLALAPLLALAALAVKLDSPGPVFFRQQRMGSGERPFEILKFRTMVVDADARKSDIAHLNRYLVNGDARMFKVRDDPRTTRVGRVLRRFSLDELPQLINVVRGEMSLVGPRPLVLDEDSHVAGWGRSRLDLRPGITGPWQVLGRNDIPFDEMVMLDYLYVTGWSLAHDVGLLLRTLPAVVRSREAY